EGGVGGALRRGRMGGELAIDGEAHAEPIEAGALVAVQETRGLDAIQDVIGRALRPAEARGDLARRQFRALVGEQRQDLVQLEEHGLSDNTTRVWAMQA